MTSFIYDAPGSSGTQKDKQPVKEKVSTPKSKFNKENVCYFYATNKCKFGKECRKEHPKICNKFKKYGLKKFNKNNGCNEDCEFYHPMACFELMKTDFNVVFVWSEEKGRQKDNGGTKHLQINMLYHLHLHPRSLNCNGRLKMKNALKQLVVYS